MESSNQIHGVVVGIVKDVNDPTQLGRIKVNFPWLSEDNSSQWARVATFMSGPQRGSWFMPELEDEVLVAFELADVQHPYIIGFLWNGSDKPPNDGIDTKVRRLRTVSGHVIELDDRPGQERVLIKTKAGHQIEMKDTPPASIDIKTVGGQEIKLEDTPAKITLQTAAANKIEISDLPAGITISAPTGMLNVTCLQATVNASTLLSVNAPIAQFSGIVQASVVVAAAYVPAPGDTFGL